MKLYEISSHIQSLLIALEETEGYSPELEAALEALTDKLEVKLDNIHKVRLDLKKDIAALKFEEDRLNARRKALENKYVQLSDYIEAQLERAGIQKVRTPLFSFSISPTKSIDVLDEALVPDQYKTTEVITKVSKDAITEDVKAGAKVPPGVEVVEGWRLTVR